MENKNNILAAVKFTGIGALTILALSMPAWIEFWMRPDMPGLELTALFGLTWAIVLVVLCTLYFLGIRVVELFNHLRGIK
jgi:hypothetical protein